MEGDAEIVMVGISVGPPEGCCEDDGSKETEGFREGSCEGDAEMVGNNVGPPEGSIEDDGRREIEALGFEDVLGIDD